MSLMFSTKDLTLGGMHAVNRSRFLRETDRRRNGMDFPKLYYPELYLLEGGYRKFFESHSVTHLRLSLLTLCYYMTYHLGTV